MVFYFEQSGGRRLELKLDLVINEFSKDRINNAEKRSKRTGGFSLPFAFTFIGVLWSSYDNASHDMLSAGSGKGGSSAETGSSRGRGRGSGRLLNMCE